MTKNGVLLLFPLCLLQAQSLVAQAQVLPDAEPAPAVDTITPVPAPEIPFGGPEAVMPTLPDSVKLSNLGGKIEGNMDEGVRFGGPVKISADNGLEIFANTAFWNVKDLSITFEGDVSIYQGNLLQRGQRAVYYYERKFLDASGLRASVDPLLLEAGKFTAEEANGQMVFVGENAGITTHDYQDPNFWIRSERTTVYPGDRVTFRNLKLYAGDTPVFWLPYLSQPLAAELGYHVVPGARSNWGPYLLNTYGILLGGKQDPVTGENHDAWLLSKWHLDLRTSRGIGTGVDLRDAREDRNSEITGLSLYYLNDLDPNTRRSGVPRGFVNEDRWHMELKQRVPFELNDNADWRVDTNLTLLSDAYYLEDFDPSRYRYDPAPDNTIGIFRRDEKSLLSLFARLRLNDFYRTDTRTPEIAYDQARGPLFGSPVLHEGSTSFGIMDVQAADPTRRTLISPLLALPPGHPDEARLLSQLSGYERELAIRIRDLQAADPTNPDISALRAQLLDTGFTRFHTYHEFSLPMVLGGWLTLTPQAGIGYTNYTSVEGPANSLSRTHFHAGTEASLKFSKDLSGKVSREWGLDGLLHVLQPYANWSFLATDEMDSTQPRIDRLTFTTRPRTLSPSRFTATDDLEGWNILRLGTRNRLLTKRDGQTHEWLYVNTYMDAFIEDPEEQRNFSNLYNDVRWQPLPWLAVDLETQFPVIDNGSGFREYATALAFQPNPDFEFSIGYRMLQSHPVLLDSQHIDLKAYARINENWGVGMQHVWELDDGTLELQQYTLHRDLGNWVAGVGLTHRDNRTEDEFGIIFSLTLKDFPSVSLPFDIDAQ
jgi:LPS-assembly protein